MILPWHAVIQRTFETASTFKNTFFIEIFPRFFGNGVTVKQRPTNEKNCRLPNPTNYPLPTPRLFVVSVKLLGDINMVANSSKNFVCEISGIPQLKKWGVPLRISSVNVTKSTVSSGFCHIYWRNPKWKTLFFVQCT